MVTGGPRASGHRAEQLRCKSCQRHVKLFIWKDALGKQFLCRRCIQALVQPSWGGYAGG